MKLEIGKKYSGFILNEIIPIKELSGVLYDMEHEKSGARLIYFDREDNNKVFYASFRTLPENSTGVFHIIEHSVLCGSKKYPVKEPFVDLLKGSMNTFLNAMTYPDKTVYPCASCNDKDFANLMSVYMDAVFSPAIYTCENIFRQEGHHIELLSEDGEASFKGVVFNEMKGAFSSVDSRIYSSISKALFPDTPYSYSSGGDPSYIPDLTYEDFLSAHRKYYHPENCILYLYGTLDILDRLEFLDREYLSGYEKTGAVIEIKPQKPVEDLNVFGEYQLSDTEKPEKNTYITYAIVNGDYSDREKMLAYDVIFDAIASNNSSPLKKAILDKGLGDDLYAYMSEGILHPYAVFKLRKTDADKKDEFLSLLIETLEGFVKEGLDKSLLRASFNQLEFSMREGDTGSGPVGLNYGLMMLNSLNYGGRPETFLVYEDILEKVRAGFEKEGYFEGILSELLESRHRALCVTAPSRDFTERLERAEKERIDRYMSTLTSEEKKKLVEDNESLIDFQSREDSEEAKATIPMLKISDIDTSPALIETDVRALDGGEKVLFHNFKTNKISYIRLFFDLSSLSENELSYASMASSLLFRISTENYGESELNTLIKMNLGGVYSYSTSYVSRENIDFCTGKFVVELSVLDSNMEKAFFIVNEVINNTLFKKDEIEKLLRQKLNRLKQDYVGNGTSKAIRRVFSYDTVSGAYSEKLGGYDFYLALSSLMENYEERFDSFKETLLNICKKVFNRKGLTISLTGGENAYNELSKYASVLSLSAECEEKHPTPKPVYNGNEGFIVPSRVNYVAKGVNIIKKGIEYSGKMAVFSQILDLDYMWNTIRVKGGAYGAGFNIKDTGEMYASSYRDPSVEKTLDAFDRAREYIDELVSENPDITNYIISTVASYTSPLSEKDRGAHSDFAYFSGITNERKKKILNEMLSTTVEDVEKMAELIDLLREEGMSSVVGEGEKIKSAENAFPIIYEI